MGTNLDINEIYKILSEHKLFVGRMISSYKKSPKGCTCVWNGNIVTRTYGKIWYGDLNLTKEGDILKEIANCIGEPLYILRESDCRFGSENDPIDTIIGRSIWNTTQNLV